MSVTQYGKSSGPWEGKANHLVSKEQKNEV